jgi:hypothetical protein
MLPLPSRMRLGGARSWQTHAFLRAHARPQGRLRPSTLGSCCAVRPLLRLPAQRQHSCAAPRRSVKASATDTHQVGSERLRELEDMLQVGAALLYLGTLCG